MKKRGIYWTILSPIDFKCIFCLRVCAPICSYLTSIGLGEIMKPLCETDSVMFAYQHGTLHRDHTIASGSDVCDYWVVGDRVKYPERKCIWLLAFL